MKTTCLLFFLAPIVLFCGCKEAEPKPSTSIVVRWFEESEGFAGTITVGFKDAEPIYEKYPDYPKTTVFWDVGGKAGSVAAPDPIVYHIAWSSALEKLALVTFKGVYTLDPNSGTVEAIWQKDLLSPYVAVDPGGRFALVTGREFGHDIDFIAVVDLLNGTTSLHDSENFVNGMAFANENKALVSTVSELLAVRHVDGEKWVFDTVSDNHTLGRLIGIIGGAPVYGLYTGMIVCGEKSVEVKGFVRTVAAGDDAILITTYEGEVLRIDTQWQPSRLASFSPDNIIGSGVFSEGGWIATDDSKVHTFNGSGSETTHDIRIPQSASK